MNIKLSLLITLATLGGSMNAENNNLSKTPIRDRLVRQQEATIYKASKKELRRLRLIGSDFIDLDLFIPSYLLDKMVNCIDSYNKFHEIKTVEDEKIIAALCSDTLSKKLNEQYTGKEKELILKELRKIKKKT